MGISPPDGSGKKRGNRPTKNPSRGEGFLHRSLVCGHRPFITQPATRIR
jgi:hypothetical protein